MTNDIGSESSSQIMWFENVNSMHFKMDILSPRERERESNKPSNSPPSTSSPAAICSVQYMVSDMRSLAI